MTGSRGAAEPARHALLGLLLEGPSHGYDLLRHFDRSAPLGDIVHLTASNLYALLTRLERERSIAGEQQEAGARPQRRVYQLTADGRATILAWLATPVNHPRDMLIEFPLKLYLARSQSESNALDLIARQATLFRDYIARLKAVSEPELEAFDRAYVRLMRVGRIGRAQGAIDWLRAAERLIRSDEHAPRCS
jgi:DNA-binding PadR family transcriptional regulator